ncbi:IDEAL domain-containing protein [Bacillus salitolerans]|uniref:IDEAL domain-containing protein n=1 Tax=Bacillus salitolerans TaxID=1437434 RepID=A0ABW4LL06_9BACI
MSQYQQEPKNELMIVCDHTEDESEFSLAAKLILDQSILIFNRQRLMKQIDKALERGDKKEFLELSRRYTQLLS